MMELMEGIPLIIQVVCIALAALFLFISYGAGVFWVLEDRGVKLSFSLWKFCSSFESTKICKEIHSENHLDEVVLTSRACGGIAVLLIAVLAGFITAWIISLRRSMVSDLWLHARTVLLFLLVLFMLIFVTHSKNCPPMYNFGLTKMPVTMGWGWGLLITSFVLVIPVCGIHIFEEVQLYRSKKNKT